MKEITIWRIAAILCFIFAIFAFAFLMLIVEGFNSFTNTIEAGNERCASYCTENSLPYFLFDVGRQACQCYDENSDPASYANFQTMYEGDVNDR